MQNRLIVVTTEAIYKTEKAGEAPPQASVLDVSYDPNTMLYFRLVLRAVMINEALPAGCRFIAFVNERDEVTLLASPEEAQKAFQLENELRDLLGALNRFVEYLRAATD